MRLAELIGTLSMATDAGAGMPDCHALRSAVVAVRLAELAQQDDRTVCDAFYLPLLAMSGCSAESGTAAEALGDEVAIGIETYGLDWGRASEMLPPVLRLARRGRGPIGGIVAMARAMSKLAQNLFTDARKVADAKLVDACWRAILKWPATTVLTYHDPAGHGFHGDVRAAIEAAARANRQLLT